MAERQDVDLWALSDLATPWCMHVVATLRIADYLAAGTTAIDDLARASGADADSLARVLRHLVGKGVFTEPTPGQFALNAAADMLRDGHPSRLRFGLDLNGIGNRMAYAWGTLLTAVQTGKPAYADLFGRPFWDDLDAHPEIAASFDALMGPAGHGTPDPDILLADDWDSVRLVVDVGGGTGTLLAEILRTRPGLHGTRVDRPGTVARSGETFQAAGVADRVTTVGATKNVLGDWPDDEAVRLLRRCADAARPTGRVVILGGVTPEDEGTAPSPALLMMVLVGGRERRLAEFTELARPAGLEVTAAARQAAGRFVVECRPV